MIAPDPAADNALSWIDDDLRERRRQGLYRRRRRIRSGQGPLVVVDGRELVNFASNDYLGLAGDRRLATSAAGAARRYGSGAGSSALVSGHHPALRRLERRLARWEETEAALVFSSGFAANLALVSSLATREDVIFSDALNHASLIDGCRLSRAAIEVYHHCDLGHLDELLRRDGPRARRRLIVTDTVFSMDGDLAPLRGLLELAEQHDALVLADEAHATGVLGAQGRGASDLLPRDAVSRRRLIKVGTLSKALGAQGGFVVGPRRLIDWLVNRARPYIFSTALAPPVAAAASRALSIVEAEPERRSHLAGLANRLRERLKGKGVDVGGSVTQIVPVVVGDARAAVDLSNRLEQQGFLVPAIRPPSVPEGTARLRISLTAGHTEAQVDQLASLLIETLRVQETP